MIFLIDTIRVRINRIHSKLEDSDNVITAAKIRDKYNGVGEKRKSIKEVFEYHNLMVKQTIGKDFALGTFKRYETTLKHIQEFIKHQYRLDELELDEIKFKFITDFEFYLKTVRGCNHNSTLKYIRNFRKIINLAIANEWTKTHS